MGRAATPGPSPATQGGFPDEAKKLAEALEGLRSAQRVVCEECGASITIVQLRATPEATTCPRCRGSLERSARRLQACDFPTRDWP